MLERRCEIFTGNWNTFADCWVDPRPISRAASTCFSHLPPPFVRVLPTPSLALSSPSIWALRIDKGVQRVQSVPPRPYKTRTPRDDRRPTSAHVRHPRIPNPIKYQPTWVSWVAHNTPSCWNVQQKPILSIFFQSPRVSQLIIFYSRKWWWQAYNLQMLCLVSRVLQLCIWR